MAGSANSGRIGVLEDGMRGNGNSFSPDDTEYIAGRRLTYEEVAIVYGFDPSAVRAGLDDEGVDAEENHRRCTRTCSAPLLRKLQDEIELQLLPECRSRSADVDHVLRVQHRRQAEGLVRGAGQDVDDVGRCADR